MKTNRRDFLSVAGASALAAGTASASNVTASLKKNDAPSASMTELFLDNQLLEVTPSVSRKLHPPRKHPLNPVVRCDRWCDGNNIQPYTTMYDDEDKLFKM